MSFLSKFRTLAHAETHIARAKKIPSRLDPPASAAAADNHDAFALRPKLSRAKTVIRMNDIRRRIVAKCDSEYTTFGRRKFWRNDCRRASASPKRLAHLRSFVLRFQPARRGVAS